MTRVPGYHPRRVAPFGDLGIAGCQRLPRAFRRVAASFLGRQRLGIHRAPIFAASSAALAAPRSRRRPGLRSGPARATLRRGPTLRARPTVPSASGAVRGWVRCGPLPIRSDADPFPNRIARSMLHVWSRAPDRGRTAAGGSARPRLPGGEHAIDRPPRIPGANQPATRQGPGRARSVVKVPTPRRPRGRHRTPGVAPGRVEPRGFEPRTSAVQGRRSPG